MVKNNEKARIDLLKEVEGITKEMLHKKPGEDQWSINQIIEHLYLMEISIVRSMEKELVNDRKTTVDDKPIHLAVNRKYKVAAPEAVQPSETFHSLEELTQKLVESREKLIKFVQHTDEELLKEKAMPHPGFNMLNLSQWVSFIGWHERRHIEQIKEVKEKLEW